MKKNQKAALIIIGVAFLIAYIVSLQSQASEAAKQNDNLKNEIETLSEIENQEAANANKTFLTTFFNYDDVTTRNEEIRDLMTAEGYQSIQIAEGSQEADISVSATNIKSYERKTDKKNSTFLTEFDLTVNLDSVSDTSKNYVQTDLIYIEGKGWKIDKVSILGIAQPIMQD